MILVSPDLGSVRPRSSESESAHRAGATWSFPGRRDRGTGSALFLALLGAAVLHAGLSFVETKVHAKSLPPRAVELETLVPIETLSEPEPEPKELPQHLPPTSPDSSQPKQEAPVTSPIPLPLVDAPGALTAEPDAGLAPDDAAAPLASADFGDSDWSLLSGSGSALGGGKLGLARRGSGSRKRATTLKARDLSRNAQAPHLDPLVQRNFPAAARLARVEGRVTISAVIQASGTPTDIRVEDVSTRGRGFGETCSRTVHEGPDWKPKLNRDGRPVASKVHYTCQFRLPKHLLSESAGPSKGTGANRVWTRPAGG